MKKRNYYPLVSICIPTWNSEKTLPMTLNSIKRQTYKNYEVIIIDKNSNDSTRKIASSFKAKVLIDKNALLSARYKGFKHSKGKILILLDSDQILNKNAIKRAVELLEKKFDMLFLEESSYNPETIAQKLMSIDKKMIHKKAIINPSESVLLPRAFKRKILSKVFSKINKKLYDFVTLEDHAIIYYESYKISKKIGYLENAVFHKEPETLLELFKHYSKWGERSGKDEKKLPLEYKKMFSTKLRNRYKSISFFNYLFLPALLIITIKCLGYYAGIIRSKIS